MIAAAVVGQPCSLTGQIHPKAEGMSHRGSRKTKNASYQDAFVNTYNTSIIQNMDVLQMFLFQ